MMRSAIPVVVLTYITAIELTAQVSGFSSSVSCGSTYRTLSMPQSPARLLRHPWQGHGLVPVVPWLPPTTRNCCLPLYSTIPQQLDSSTSSSDSTSNLVSNLTQLKVVLEREYLSFFNPMEREYYASSVTFNDPLTKLEGVDGYQKNVDMLAGRSLLGSLLFSDASINLHSVTGGTVSTSPAPNGQPTIEKITTRWTLRFTFKALPWRPTARFSGISIYTVIPGGPKGVQIVEQFDYWDSINLRPRPSSTGTPHVTYQAVGRSVALKHFIDQIKPGNFAAIAAGPELPYSTLRLGNGYEVRRYPIYSAVQMRYERRDEAFSSMGSFTSGMKPMAPAFMQVNADASKTMQWPLDFCTPGQSEPAINETALRRAARAEHSDVFAIETVPSRVVAVRIFGDALVEPVVRRVDMELREILVRDGLVVDDSSQDRPLLFAQYDAVYSMGQRRSEVHIRLKDGGHPW